MSAKAGCGLQSTTLPLALPGSLHQGQAGLGWSRVIVMTERLHWPAVTQLIQAVRDKEYLE